MTGGGIQSRPGLIKLLPADGPLAEQALKAFPILIGQSLLSLSGIEPGLCLCSFLGGRPPLQLGEAPSGGLLCGPGLGHFLRPWPRQKLLVDRFRLPNMVSGCCHFGRASAVAQGCEIGARFADHSLLALDVFDPRAVVHLFELLPGLLRLLSLSLSLSLCRRGFQNDKRLSGLHSVTLSDLDIGYPACHTRRHLGGLALEEPG
jgi:hypothetical protein